VANKPPKYINQNYINVVRHADIFPEFVAIPNYSSQVIESHLHRIPGLTENFLYFNDDIFVMGDFETKNFFPRPNVLGVPIEKFFGLTDYNRGIYEATRSLFRKNFDYKKSWHHLKPMNIGLARSVWSEWPHELTLMSTSQIRNLQVDLDFFDLYYNFGTLHNQVEWLQAGEEETPIFGLLTDDVTSLIDFFQRLSLRKSKFAGISDNMSDKGRVESTKFYKRSMRIYFPNESRFEKRNIASILKRFIFHLTHYTSSLNQANADRDAALA